MRLVVGTAWSAVAADVADPQTAGILCRAFSAMPALEGSIGAPILAQVGEESGGTVSVTTANGRVSRAPGMDAALEVATEFNRALLDRCPHFAVHAAALAAPGGVIALPGESGVGKSTLAAACTVQGFGYLSDEALLLTSQGTVVPYPRPLALSAWSQTAVGIPIGTGASEGHPGSEKLVDPLGLSRVTADTGGMEVCAVVRMRRSAGAPALIRLPRSHAVIELLRNSFNHFRDPAAAVELAHDVARRAEAYELVVGEPKATALLLASHFGI